LALLLAAEVTQWGWGGERDSAAARKDTQVRANVVTIEACQLRDRTASVQE